MPRELQELPQWVVWQMEDPEGERRKTPRNPNAPQRYAKVNDPATWGTFEKSLSVYIESLDMRTPLSGIGFVFTDGDPYVGVDLDDCFDAEGVNPHAQEIIAHTGGYAEVSPSGTGVKIFTRGQLATENTGSKALDDRWGGELEVYHRGRWFAVTGDQLGTLNGPIPEAQEVIDGVWSRIQRLKAGMQDKRQGGRATSPTRMFPVNSGATTAGRRVSHEDRERRCFAYLKGDWCKAISGEGGHNATLQVACETVRFDLDEAAARRVMDWFNAERCQPSWNKRDLYRKLSEAEKVAGGQRGIRLHEEAEPAINSSKRLQRNKDGAGAGRVGRVGDVEGGEGGAHETGDPGRSISSPGRRPTTDAGNAERLVDDHGDHIRYCASWGAWLVWDGKRWLKDDRGEVRSRAKQTVRGIHREAAEEADESRRKKLASWAMQSEARTRIDNMLRLASSEQEVVVTADQLDADPWAVNVKNGTLDLRTGELRPHDPSDHHTRLCPVEYHPDASCERWQRFIEQVSGGDAGLASYLQMLAGLSMTGDISEQIFPVLYGPGGNGKSVFTDTLCWIMGEYAGVAPDSLVTVNAGQEHPTEIADLVGKRLVVATENEAGKRLRVGLVKRMTGDATLKGRYMRQDYFEFNRTHKTWLVTNHRPAVHESKNAVWRRLHLVPFTVTFPRSEQDKRLPDKLKAEASGILAWVVRGCMAWLKYGLRVPGAVESATNNYRRQSDPLADFLKDYCVVDGDPNSVVSRQDIARNYNLWATEVGEKDKLSRTAIYERLEEHPKIMPAWVRFSDGRKSRGFRGIYLRPRGTRATAAA